MSENSVVLFQPDTVKRLRRDAIPVLHVRGTHYEVGYSVGCTFRMMIKDFLQSAEWYVKQLLQAYASVEGRKAYDISLKTAEDNFPQYVQEIRGTADGAEVPFHELMLLHLDRLVLPQKQKVQLSAPIGCSSIICNHENQVLLGHTEDALVEFVNRVYIVSAHVTQSEPQGDGTSTPRPEVFTALCYAGYLPGFCMGYNHHGLVFSINVLSPEGVVSGNTAPYFLTRALLTAESLEEARLILQDKGVGAADGFSVNMCFVPQGGEVEMVNAEVAPSTGGALGSLYSEVSVAPGQHYLHTNQYAHLSFPEKPTQSYRSSYHRQERAGQLPPPDCRAALLEVLSDTHHAEHPFFREGQGEIPVATATLGLFDLLKKTWTLWMRNPRHCDPLVTMPLSFKWSK